MKKDWIVKKTTVEKVTISSGIETDKSMYPVPNPWACMPPNSHCHQLTAISRKLNLLTPDSCLIPSFFKLIAEC